MAPMEHSDEVPVLIVGAGPAGSTLALHLARLGVKPLVVSKHRGTANTPRAHIFNQRAMEVLRDAGLESRLQDVACPADKMQHTSWSRELGGEEYGRMWSWGNKPSELHRYANASPCSMSDLPQSVLEPILVEEAVKHGAEIRFGIELQSLKDCGEYVEATVRDRSQDLEYTIRAKYLVGADGARSKVVDELGIVIDGVQLNTAFNVHIKADLSKYMVNRPGSLNWVLNPDAPDWSAVGNFRMVRPWDEWVVSMHPASKEGKPFEPTAEQIQARLKQMIGDNNIAVTILSSFRWTINDQVARTWHKGRVVCIGDAVHRHPPINGLGSNTCISDAFNLAWKLAYVLRGVAGQDLVATLSAERKPVGDAVVRRANNGMEAHRRIWGLLGVTQETRAKAVATLETASAEGKTLRRDLRQAFEATDAELQALGMQMNQIYAGSSATYTEPDDHEPDTSHVDLLKEVAISTFPGYHLPHFWVAASGQSPRQSSLDICGQGRFTLLTGIGGECWQRAAQEITAAALGLDVRCHSIGYRCDFLDCYNDWDRVRKTDEDGVVLVRPDHFVAWRYRTSSENASELLRNVLGRILLNGSIAAES